MLAFDRTFQQFPTFSQLRGFCFSHTPLLRTTFWKKFWRGYSFLRPLVYQRRRTYTEQEAGEIDPRFVSSLSLENPLSEKQLWTQLSVCYQSYGLRSLRRTEGFPLKRVSASRHERRSTPWLQARRS
jgi:hypothetical protein